MTLRHRIWELVTAITTHSRATKTATSEQAAQTTTANRIKELEAEISRLTWTVLDGKATEAQRRRLAELVNEQHEQRRA